MCNFQMCPFHFLCHPFSRMECGGGGGEPADSDCADEDTTQWPYCPDLIQGPATSSITWKLVRNRESEALAQTYWIKILMSHRGTGDVYILELEQHCLRDWKNNKIEGLGPLLTY